MQNLYHIRITLDISNPKYAEFAQQRAIKHILVRENEDVDCKQPHLHMMVSSLHKNDQAIRSDFRGTDKKKGWFTMDGNKDYSLKCATEDGWKYVCKGEGPDFHTQGPVVLSTTFRLDEIQEFHRLYWEHRNRIIVNLAQDDVYEPKKPPRKKRPCWTLTVVQEIKEEHVGRLWSVSNEDDRHYIIDKLLSRMGELGKTLDKFIMIRLFNGVYNALDKSETSKKVFRHCIDNEIIRHWN